MSSIRIHAVSDSRGDVRVVVPVASPNENVEIVVQWGGANRESVDMRHHEDAWPEHWLDRVIGSLADDPTFRRPDPLKSRDVEPLV